MNKNINRILLITPPYIAKGITPHPQMGLAYLAGYLEKFGFEVKIIDFMALGWEQSETDGSDHKFIGLPDDDMKKMIADFSPDLIGVHNNFTSQYKMPHIIFRIAKEISPDIITTTGGNHATVCPELCLEDPNLDYVILGEGELPTRNLISYLNGECPLNALEGIAYRNVSDNQIVIIPPTGKIDNLDEIPFPARHLLDLELYWKLGYSHGRRKTSRFTPFITSRGCPFHCSFCSFYCVSGRKYRVRSPENVIDELKILKTIHGIEEITFEDDNLILNTERAEKIFDLMIQEQFNFKWECPNGIAIGPLTKTLIKKMHDSGCYRLNLAIESGNQYVLDNVIHKPVDLKKIPSLIRYAHSLGMEVMAFFVVGTPGETKDQIMDTYKYAASLNLDRAFFSICVPLVGSEAYNLCKERHYFDPDFSLDKLDLEHPFFSTEYLTSSELFTLYQEGNQYLIRRNKNKRRINRIKVKLSQIFALTKKSP